MYTYIHSRIISGQRFHDNIRDIHIYIYLTIREELANYRFLVEGRCQVRGGWSIS